MKDKLAVREPKDKGKSRFSCKAERRLGGFWHNVDTDKTVWNVQSYLVSALSATYISIIWSK